MAKNRRKYLKNYTQRKDLQTTLDDFDNYSRSLNIKGLSPWQYPRSVILPHQIAHAEIIFIKRIFKKIVSRIHKHKSK